MESDCPLRVGEPESSNLNGGELAMKVELHCHTNISDGSCSFEEVLEFAANEGILHLAITNHDTTYGLQEMVEKGKETGLEIIPSIEVSGYDFARGRRVPLLGYYVDYEHKALFELCQPLIEKRHAASEEMVRSMNRDPTIFAMANPTPEIMPDRAKAAGALVVGTGRSDFSNQVNNVLAFPGIFRGALDVRAKEINEEMRLAAVFAIADLIGVDDLHTDFVILDPFARRVAAHVAVAVADAAMETGVSQKNIDVAEIEKRLLVLVEEKQNVFV